MRFTFAVGREELVFFAGRLAVAEAKLRELLAAEGRAGVAYRFVDAEFVCR